MRDIISQSGADYFGVKAEEFAFAFSEATGGDPVERFSMAMDLAAKRLETRPQYGTANIYTPELAGPIPETDPKRLEAAKNLREGTEKLLKLARETQAAINAAPSAASLRPATAIEKYGPPPTPAGYTPMSVPPELVKPPAIPAPRAIRDPRQGQTWEKAFGESESFSDEFENSMKPKPKPLPGSASAAGPVFQGLAATVDKFGQLIAKFDSVADKFIESGRRSPLLGSAKEDA
jgi:hypothetical protein